MRKLAWFTFGFGIASILCAYWFPSWIWIPAIIAPIVGVLLLVGQKFFRFLRIFTVIFLGFSLGVGWFYSYDALFLSAARSMDGKISSELLEITGYPVETTYGYAVDALYTRDGKAYQAIVYLDEKAEVSPGDTLQGIFRFRFTAIGGEKDPTYRRSNGIFLTLQLKDDYTVHKASEVPLKYFPVVLNHSILQIIDRTFQPDVAAFAKGLLLGDKIDLPYTDYNAFRLSGISHIIAVSGLHVGIIIAFLYFLTGKRRFLSCLLGLPTLLLFAAIVGFKPSVNRACIMQALLLISMAIDREYDGITALSFSGLVMMLINPMVVIDIGFQLSFTSVFGIFLFASPIHHWIVSRKWVGAVKGKQLKYRLKRWIIGCISVTISAGILTTPFVAYYFGAVSLVSVITNLLVLWAIPIAFYVLALTVGLAAILGSLPELLLIPATIIVRYILTTARLISRLPFAAVYTASIYTVLWLIVLYVLLAAFLMMRRKPVGVFAAAITVSLIVCTAFGLIEPRLDSCRMTVLDVGQGQCILLQWSDKTYMVDCGGSYDSGAANAAADTLLSQGISKIDGIILTHFDRDHYGGLPYFLSRIRVGELFFPDVPEKADVMEEIQHAAGVVPTIVASDYSFSHDRGSIQLIPSVINKSDNESGLCILFRHEKCDILITGDRDLLGELFLVKQHTLPKVDVLIAGHHGSKSSTGQLLLDTVQPDYVMISVADNNSYNLPAQQLLDRLAEFGCVIYRTDIHGTITFRR